MFQISPDQTQWFHLYRVQKVYPVTFVLFACEETTTQGDSSRMLDLRIVSNDQNILGGSWCVKSEAPHTKQVSRADCTKFLELHAKFYIANAIQKAFDEIELIESSREELSTAASLDGNFKNNLEAVAATFYPKLARNLIRDINVNHTGIEYEELLDWPTRNTA